MPLPDLTVIAEGDAPGGGRWCLKAGGPAEDYYTLIETVHPDGHRDEGGMGGPALAAVERQGLVPAGAKRPGVGR